VPATSDAVSPERRLVIQTASLAALAAIVASFTPFVRALGVVTGEGARLNGSGGGEPTPAPSGVATLPTPSAPGASVPAGAIAVATIAAVKSKGSASFIIPFNAPAPLPAGDPGVIVLRNDGSFVAFDAVCTHAGCTVQWDNRDHVLFCPCHDAVFDAEHDAAVLGGPAPAPLTALPIVIDTASGKILLDPTA
jgi:thiosulfate dehydrogenase [quinone] large subunit